MSWSGHGARNPQRSDGIPGDDVRVDGVYHEHVDE